MLTLARGALSVPLLMSMSEDFSAPFLTLIKLCYTHTQRAAWYKTEVAVGEITESGESWWWWGRKARQECCHVGLCRLWFIYLFNTCIHVYIPFLYKIAHLNIYSYVEGILCWYSHIYVHIFKWTITGRKGSCFDLRLSCAHSLSVYNSAILLCVDHHTRRLETQRKTKYETSFHEPGNRGYRYISNYNTVWQGV